MPGTILLQKLFFVVEKDSLDFKHVLHGTKKIGVISLKKIKEKNVMKGHLGSQKWFFYGVTAESPF